MIRLKFRDEHGRLVVYDVELGDMPPSRGRIEDAGTLVAVKAWGWRKTNDRGGQATVEEAREFDAMPLAVML